MAGAMKRSLDLANADSRMIGAGRHSFEHAGPVLRGSTQGITEHRGSGGG